MPHVELATLEEALLVALGPLKAGEPGGYLRTLKAYEGELDVEAADQLNVQWPAALVFIESITYVPVTTNAQEYSERPQVAVFVGDQNWRGAQDVRRGGAASDIGTYRMIRDTRDALAGKTFGLDVGPLIPRDVRSVLSLRTPPVSVYRLSFEFSDVSYVAP